MKQLYQEFASLVGAYKRCAKQADTREWMDKHEFAIERLCKELMPHGSGFDSGTALDLDSSTGEKLVFTTSFHHMNETGYYCGWTEHSVIVRPSLELGFTLRITGRDRNDIKEYIGEMFHDILSRIVERKEAGYSVHTTGDLRQFVSVA